MKRIYDVIVIGGGVIGSTIAWQLAKTKRSVLLLERGQLGQEASSAAAGMLGAELEIDRAGAFFQLCLESRSMYPAFSDELIEQTGIDIELTHNGILRVAMSEEQAIHLQQTADWQRAAGGSATFLSADDMMNQEPALAKTSGGLLLPKDGNVNATLVARAVGKAASLTADVLEGAEVYDIHSSSDEVTVRTATSCFVAEQVVVANGAFANQFFPALHMQPTLIPIKGQLLRILPVGRSKLTRTISQGHHYFVPKRDGSIIVGATEEQALYSHTNTVAGVAQLLQAIQETLPGLEQATFVSAWTGLRPALPSKEPLIGPTAMSSRVLLAVGHYRNGILLAPVTASMMTAILDESPQPMWRESFLPARSLMSEESLI
ncbi:MAG: glycine oxidase ThiO [Acidibacillus sp.]|nr:glycine oxidase ThiO [Acidibacillus sp.]